MKKNSRIETVLLIVLMALLCVPFASCTKENGGGNNTGIEFRMNTGTGIHYGANHLELLDGVLLLMGSTNNFFIGYAEGRIASVGSVANLSRIRNIPESGWVDEIAVRPGTGYVIRSYRDDPYSYARLYVEDWIRSTDGGIIGAILWYEDNWR